MSEDGSGNGSDRVMLTLFLLRHAKSSWAQPAMRDIDRPLNERGLRDAPRMGRFLAARTQRPELILCSPAQRTRETLNLVLPELSADGIAIAMPSLIYEGDAGDYLQLIRTHGGLARAILLVAHNPSIHDLAVRLTGEAEADTRDAMARKFPTCALAELSFSVDGWKAVEPGAGRLESFTTPAML